jgi:hypothetical protein
MRTSPSPSRRLVPASVLGTAVLALSLLLPASASAWVREAAPTIDSSIIQPDSSMTVLPDGSGRYLMLGAAGSVRGNRLVVRPPAGPAAFVAPFPAVFGEYSSFDFLFLSPADAAGNQLAVREASPFGVAFLAPGADPAAATVEPTRQITQIDVAPSGEAAAIMSENSEAYVSFRAAGPAGRFDTPRRLDRAGNMRSYGIGITIDPDGGVLVVYRTEQSQAVLQTYAPPGGAFGAPQQVDVPATAISGVRYGQSTNGHALLAWSEDVRGDTNSDQVWVVSRQPGGLLTGRAMVAEAAPGRLVTAHIAAVTDDGTAYLSYLDANPVSGCPSNNDGDGGSVLAVRGGGGSWAKLNEPTRWPQREDVQAISTVGNAVGAMTLRTTDNGARCADTDATSAIDVRLGQGAALGAPVAVASESITGVRNGTLVRPYGFAVNATGGALLLTNEPLDAASRGWFLYAEGMSGGGGPAPGPGGPGPGDGPGRPLPAPGRVTFGGAKLVARGGEIPFEASCVRLPGEGSRLFCSIGAILLEQERRRGGGRAAAAHVSAARARGRRGARGRRVAPPRVLAVARAVRVPVGTTRRIAAKLTRAGRRLLRAAGRRGLPVTIRVTIVRAGYAPRTIERRLTLVAGRARGRRGRRGGRAGRAGRGGRRR